MTTEVVAPPRCQACLSTDVHVHSASRRTGQVILSCRHCGLHALAERPELGELVELLDVDRDWFAGWVERTRGDVIDKSHAQVLERLAAIVGPAEDRSLFDVGAGEGGFLAMARDKGFRPSGNDVATGAIDLARERNGIELHMGDLSTLEGVGLHDVVTMWCVLAHVPDGNRLLADAFNVLKPGGVLYLQTPRWSAMDTAGMAAHDVTKGRSTRITDRRLALHHMALHTPTSMRINLERLGYEIITIEPKVRYSLNTADYLGSLGVGQKASGRLAKPIDKLLERDLFFRNVIDVYARKPS
jgi:2-polyprenyl-3-methyl-5-hydroxy-6-metoxy-1,4-benzoquinol methylase